MNKAHGRAHGRGFSLIEVLVAGIVLVIASVALAATMAQTAGLTEGPREEIAARHGIQSVYAVLSATPYDQVAPLFQGQGFPVPGLTPQPGDPDGLPGQIVFDYGPGGDTSYYTVTLRVAWRGRGANRLVESVHYLANVRGDTGRPPPLEEIVPPEEPLP